MSNPRHGLLATLPLVAWLALSSAALAAPSTPAEGADAYARWLTGALDRLERDLKPLSASADAAADFYVTQRHILRAAGDPAAVREVTGRSGGIMLVNHTQAARPGGRPLVFYFPREGQVDADAALLARHRQANEHVVLFGRESLIRELRAKDVAFTDAVIVPATEKGGLFEDPDGRPLVSTVPAATAAAFWTWYAEFVSACARRGAMPAVFEGYHTPGGKLREKRLTPIRFIEDRGIRALPPGAAGKQYLDKLRADLLPLFNEEAPAIRAVAAEAARRLRGETNGAVYAYLHGHFILRKQPLPFDPGYFRALNSDWTTVHTNLVLRTNDLVLCIGYNQLFRGPWFGEWETTARRAGAVLAWSIATFVTDEVDAVRPEDYLIRQPWAFGDALVEIPGHDVRIAPGSGVVAEAVYGLVVAETHRLVGAESPPPVPGERLGLPPLHQAVLAGRRDRLVDLIAAGAAPDTADRFGRTPLHLAAATDDHKLAELLLRNGADPSKPDTNGETPLHRAARAGGSSLVRLLLKAAPPLLETKDRLLGRTPLHEAARAGNHDALAALLEAGADPEATDRWGLRPVHLAAEKGGPRALHVLLEAGADLRARDGWERVALHWAAQEHQRESLAWLLERGLSPDARDRYGRTALFDAAGTGPDRTCLTLLLEAGADPSVADTLGLRPMDGSWPWVGQLLRDYETNRPALGPSQTGTAVGDWGHFLSLSPRVFLRNPDGRAFRFTVHRMRWPVAGWNWNLGDFPLRVTDPAGKVLLEGQFTVEDNARTFDIPAGPKGAYMLDLATASNRQQMVSVWIASDLKHGVVHTGLPEGSAFENRWLTTQPSVPRQWWFWVPPGTTSFTVRTQRDIGNTERERPAITVFTPRGQRMAALVGHPIKTERLFPGGKTWRADLDREIPVEPGNAGRFWSLEVRLGDAHNYSKINLSLEGVPPYLARSPEEWFNPETGGPPDVPLYDESLFMQSVQDERLPFQMWTPSPSLGDPDGVQLRGSARFALWNPEGRDLRYDLGDYIVRKAATNSPDPTARVSLTDGRGKSRLEETLSIPHHHHGARQPRPLPAVKGVLDLAVTGAERWFAYTYPGTPLVWRGEPLADGFSRFRVEVGTARNWYFRVPRGTRRFRVRAAVAAPTDAVHLEVLAPDRVMAVLYGNRDSADLEVPAGLDGKLWRLRADIGGSSRLVTVGDPAAGRHLGLDLTLDLHGVPPLLSPTWEQWFDPDDPRRPADRESGETP